MSLITTCRKNTLSQVSTKHDSCQFDWWERRRDSFAQNLHWNCTDSPFLGSSWDILHSRDSHWSQWCRVQLRTATESCTSNAVQCRSSAAHCATPPHAPPTLGLRHTVCNAISMFSYQHHNPQSMLFAIKYFWGHAISCCVCGVGHVWEPVSNIVAKQSCVCCANL